MGYSFLLFLLMSIDSHSSLNKLDLSGSLRHLAMMFKTC